MLDRIHAECLTGDKPTAITPNDVYTYVGLPFAAWCDFHAPEDAKQPPDRFQQHLMQAGMQHERDLVEDRFPDARPLEGETDEELFRSTIDAMALGAPSVHGGRLFYLPDGVWGRFDIIERVDSGTSRFGDYHYVVKEVKSATNLREDHRLQAAAYSYILARVQGYEPGTYYLVDGNGEETPYDYDEAEVLEILDAVRAIRDGTREPPPVYGGTDGGWSAYTNQQAIERNDASLLQGVGKATRERLEAAGFSTVDDIREASRSDLTDVHGVGKATADRLKVHAEVLDSGEHVQVGDVDLPDAEIEIFLDLEGTANNPYDGVQQDMDYLIGCLLREGGPGGDEEFAPFVAHDFDREGEMFHEFADWLGALPDNIKMYHWHNYESWRFERMADRYVIPSDVRRKLFDNLVDLHAVAKDAFVFPTYGNSIKQVAPYMGFEWRHDDVSGTEAIAMYYEYVDDPKGNAELLEKVIDYNEDDVVATRVVKDWLAR